MINLLKKIHNIFFPPLSTPKEEEKDLRKVYGIPDNPKTIDDLPLQITSEMTHVITWHEFAKWQIIIHNNLLCLYQQIKEVQRKEQNESTSTPRTTKTRN